MDAPAISRAISLQRFSISDHYGSAMIKQLQGENKRCDDLAARLQTLTTAPQVDITAIDPHELATQRRENEYEAMRICQDVLRGLKQHAEHVLAAHADLQEQQKKRQAKAEAIRAKICSKLAKADLADDGEHVSALLSRDPAYKQLAEAGEQIDKLLKSMKNRQYTANRSEMGTGRSPLDDVERQLQKIASNIAGVQLQTKDRELTGAA